MRNMRKDPDLDINEYLMQITENLRLFEESNRSMMKNLTVQEVHTIALIGRLESPRMSELAERGHVTRGAISIMVNKLVKKGFVKRARDVNDRRVVTAGLTPRGRSVAKEHQKYHDKVNARIIASLTDKEKRQVARLMQKIAGALA
jgi:DNA-binding MarR family transcriptional regulator